MRGVARLVSGVFCFAAVLARAEIDDRQLKTFVQVLAEHRQYPELQKDPEFRRIFGCPCEFPKADSRVVRRLSLAVLEARFKKYNVNFRTQLQAFAQYQTRVKQMESGLKNIPLSDSARRARAEIQLEQQRGSLKVFPRVLFAMSVEANIDLQNALTTLKPEDRQVRPEVKAPKMPGVYGGSAFERQRMKELEKLNLTPVDPEFYQTQLGQKLERDLGGRAQFWSYNYDSDELYVKVGKDLAKLNVTQDDSGVRFLRTRVGQQFMEPVGSDEKIDQAKARGKFLTGQEGDETLFGRYERNQPKVQEEGLPTHKAGGGFIQEGGHASDKKKQPLQ